MLLSRVNMMMYLMSCRGPTGSQPSRQSGRHGGRRRERLGGFAANRTGHSSQAVATAVHPTRMFHRRTSSSRGKTTSGSRRSSARPAGQSVPSSSSRLVPLARLPRPSNQCNSTHRRPQSLPLRSCNLIPSPLLAEIGTRALSLPLLFAAVFRPINRLTCCCRVTPSSTSCPPSASSVRSRLSGSCALGHTLLPRDRRATNGSGDNLHPAQGVKLLSPHQNHFWPQVT